MSRKEITAALKGLTKLNKRVAELTDQRQMVMEELKDKKDSMAKEIMGGADVEKLSAFISQLETSAEALAYSLDLGQKQVKAANERLAELKVADNERQAIDNLKKARKHIATIDGLAAKLDNERTALATLTKDTSRLLGRFGSVNSKVAVMRSAWQTLETFNRNWAIAKKHDSNYAQNWTDA